MEISKDYIMFDDLIPLMAGEMCVWVSYVLKFSVLISDFNFNPISKQILIDIAHMNKTSLKLLSDF